MSVPNRTELWQTLELIDYSKLISHTPLPRSSWEAQLLKILDIHLEIVPFIIRKLIILWYFYLLHNFSTMSVLLVIKYFKLWKKNQLKDKNNGTLIRNNLANNIILILIFGYTIYKVINATCILYPFFSFYKSAIHLPTRTIVRHCFRCVFYTLDSWKMDNINKIKK